MHPDIRSSVPGKCRLCGMALAPIPRARVGEYRMEVTAARDARRNSAGSSPALIRLALHDPDGKPVIALTPVHERPIHLFVVDRTLEFFAHVHPEPAAGGGFDVAIPMPAGEYAVIADFLPQNGTPQTLQRMIATPGYRGPLFSATPAPSVDLGTEKIVDGIRVRAAVDRLKGGRDSLFAFTLTDALTGAPVSDLEPFLGAPGHMLIVSADLTEASHVHPEEPSATGPTVSFHPVMPAAGLYKLWVQFQRRGHVVTVPFVFEVGEP